MKKLLILFVALSFISLMPKAASAFTLVEALLTKVTIVDMYMGVDGDLLADIELNKDQALEFNVDKLEGVLIPQFNIESLSAGWSNAVNLKGTTYTHMDVVYDAALGMHKIVQHSVGKTDIPNFVGAP